MELFDVYPLFPIEIVKGEGCKVYDAEGTEYLDLYGGHAVISVGHSHPTYIKGVTNQLNKLGFYSNSVINTLQVRLAEELGRASSYDDYSLFMVNSGAEANENALKLASFHTGKKRVLAFDKAFHGRTSAAVRVTDNPKIVSPVNEDMPVTFIPWNDASALASELSKGDVCAVIIEGIQGVGGIRVPADGFLGEVRRLCDEAKALFIIDEIQSGYGRTGKFFAHQHSAVRPDLITVAKGMGNGFPVGAVLIAPCFVPVSGMLGTTFGGNHLACAASLAVLEVMREEKLVENAATVGAYLKDALSKLPGVKEIRGEGLMLGLEFYEPIKQFRSTLLFDEKVFTGVTGTHVVRLLPPLTLTLQQAKEAVRRMFIVAEALS